MLISKLKIFIILANNFFRKKIKYITEDEFNEFKNIYINYKIMNRTLKLKFEQFIPIIEQNIDLIDNTLKTVNPKFITKELKLLMDN